MDTKILDPIRLPLNAISLIEASAGTGKTYTMVSLYLRLLLQVGENNFPMPLSVENILVVTFTEAATEELKKKVRERISKVKQLLLAYQQTQDQELLQEDELIKEIVQQYPDLEVAIQRLKLAEQNMDIAAIYTIHGFCHRILTQYAFYSGIHFTLDLVQDQTPLYHQLANQYWRKFYYPLSLASSQFIAKHLVSPTYVISQLKPYLSGELIKPSINQPHLLRLSFAEFIQQHIEASQQRIEQLKQQWLAHQREIAQLIFDELGKSYKKGEPKRLKRISFKQNNVPVWLNNIACWAKSASNELPEHLVKYFRQSKLNEHYVDEGASPITHPVFDLVDEVVEQEECYPLYAKVLLWHYLNWLREQLLDYKLSHKQKNFDDLLTLLKQALYQQEQGDIFAQLIHQQYPFAMIDEFQDTDKVQYDIFAKIYHNSTSPYNGFIMIGDPKQAIYKFRGADIFTYLAAAKEVEQKYSLNRNWRSTISVVETVNNMFILPEDQHSFLYENIPYYPVKAQRHYVFHINKQQQPPLLCYLSDKNDKQDFARACARSIQQWLYLSSQHKAILSEHNAPIKASNIAVLVRNRREAELIKNALAELQLTSVYLSDDKNVFDSKEAKELAFILMACLNPFNEKHILTAISTTLFALTSAEIQKVKQGEQDWQYWLERFVEYQRIWQYQGILAMLHRLFLDEKIPQKLFAQKNGERRLTDILHLAELLQQASLLHESHSALLRWFEEQIQGKDRQEQQQIRLESERDLIKIVTFHKSKGLEYDLVWLPFLAEDMRMPNDTIQTYYDENSQQIYWDINQQHRDKILTEAMAEELRLLYVALTRAKYQIALSLPRQFEAKKQGWNAFLYLLTRGAIGIAEKLTVTIDTAVYLQHFCDEQAILALDDLQPLDWQPHSTIASLQGKVFTGHIEKNWQISSFTALNNQQQKQKSAVENSQIFFDDAKDYDLYLADEREQEDLAELPQTSAQYLLDYSPFDFPKGMQVGVELHRYFELSDFSQGVDKALVEKLCERLQLDPQWQPAIMQWFTAVLETPLLTEGELTLKHINPAKMLRELQFYLKIKQQFNLAKFNQLLAQYHYARPAFQFEAIQGMLRGFIDLVFQHNGKYYIIDYKSNYLGTSVADYQQDKLIDYMLEANYDLQYLIYSLALHRYLRSRDPHYQYEQHFGGVIYTFLRGMNGQNNQEGVYFDKPSAELIAQLDQLF